MRSTIGFSGTGCSKHVRGRFFGLVLVALLGVSACAKGDHVDSDVGGLSNGGGEAGGGGGDAAGGAADNGGSSPGSGGSSPGTGGSSPGSGGSSPGSGGASPGSGGASPSDGGAPPGSGGQQGSGGKQNTGGSSNGGAAGAGGASGNGGVGGSAGGGVGGSGETGGVDPVGNANRNPGFVDLSPPMGAALPATGTTVSPAPPAGWNWYQIDGAICRDGSPAGFYVHNGTADKLVIYLEGGGACMNGNYCGFNPANVNEILAGDGQTVFGTAAGAGAGRQQPGVYTNNTGLQGIFDTTKTANPVKDWNQIYIPYCTGDVHFGTRKDAPVPGLMGNQQFVGHLNMRLFMGRIVPTFKNKVTRVLLTGASAGGFGAALNFSMVQDAFGAVRVDLVDDSGPPFDDQGMAPCVQKRWRDQWGFANSLPPDCSECQSTDGGRLSKLSDFLLRKHKKSNVAFISTMQDEVIRLFFSAGLADCKNYDTASPVTIVFLQGDPTVYFPAQQYTDALTRLRSNYVSTGRLATYYMGGVAPNVQWHQHIFRSRFYDKGGANPSPSIESIADFFTNFLGDKVEQIGP